MGVSWPQFTRWISARVSVERATGDRSPARVVLTTTSGRGTTCFSVSPAPGEGAAARAGGAAIESVATTSATTLRRERTAGAGGVPAGAAETAFRFLTTCP